MGKYTEPAMFVNKQFEALNKGLTDMYSNIAKNADAIRKRELAKKQQSAKQMRDWAKVYEKGTQENYQGALDFTAGQPKDDNMKKFTNDLKSTYKQGYDNIARMVASGASEGEIASYVQDQINAANTFTEGIVAFDAYSTQYNAGVQKIGKEPGKYKGNQVGDVVVGSQYNNIFTSTGTKVGEKINIDKLKMSGNLSQGVQFYYDEDGDGNIDKGEVLDLNTMAKNYGGGKNPYFKEVEDFTEITKAYKAQIDNLEKAPSFVTETSVTDANGQTRKVQHVDRKKRQEFFMDPNTEGGKLIEEIIRSKDLTMLAQSVGGFDFAQKFDGDDPVMMEMLKVGLIEKLAPTLFPGSEKLGPSSLGSTTTSKQFEDRDPEIEVIENFTKPVHDDVIAFRQSPTKNAQKIKDFVGRPYKPGSGNLGAGIISDITTTDNPPTVQVTYAVNGTTEVSRVFNMNEDADAKEFESNIINGNFPRAKRQRIEGTYDGLVSGTPYDDSKSTTRITNRSGKPSMDIDDFNEQIKGTDEVIKFNDLYDSWENNWSAANPVTSTSSATQVAGQGSAVTPANTYSFTQASGLQGSMSFGAVPSNSAGNPQITVDSDPSSTSSQIAKVLNWENENNFQNYGFTGTGGTPGLNDGYKDIEAQIKKDNPKIKGPELAAMAAEETTSKYLIGEDGVDLGSYGGKTILQNLGIDRATFDALDPELKHYLIDYKVNVTNRSARDFIMILTGDWNGQKAGGKVSDLSDEDKAKYKDFDANTNPEGFKFDAAKLQNITPRDLEIARLSLYTDGGTNLTRQAKGGKRPDQAGSGRMNDVKITPKQGTSAAADIKSFKEKVLEDYNNIEEYYIRRKLLPGDKITMANGEVLEIPKY